MKIIVIYREGKGHESKEGREIIELPDGTTWTVSDNQHMDCLKGAHGFDHYFNSDGTYDGWGGLVQCPTADTKELINAQEAARHYTSAGGRKA